MDTRDIPELMTVREVADYLRVRERTVYELVRTQRVPSCKLSGKLLFPKRLIDLWIAQSADYPHAATHLTAPPPVIAGSHDPLLDWSVRESNCELALLIGGSTDGMQRLLAGQAVACALHLVDPATGQYDASLLGKSLPGIDFVVIEWARRRQGLIVAQGNPEKIKSVADLRKRGARVALRQEGSGSALLFSKLVADAGLAADELKTADRPVRSETDIAVMVREGKADAGLAIEAVAKEQGLDFVPLQWERFDLVVRRAEYFEAPLQRLFAFTRTPPFRDRAAALGGYDVANTGAVVFNARR
ncbi:MAG TPA: helix-turn-helix transcriptional regulator [Hyphomicrobiaceae bacterium]|nr:helix-turn-helix transcriptional regulator [Hyphomicrobiaceae bacterium]